MQTAAWNASRNGGRRGTTWPRPGTGGHRAGAFRRRSRSRSRAAAGAVPGGGRGHRRPLAAAGRRLPGRRREGADSADPQARAARRRASRRQTRGCADGKKKTEPVRTRRPLRSCTAPARLVRPATQAAHHCRGSGPRSQDATMRTRGVGGGGGGGRERGGGGGPGGAGATRERQRQRPQGGRARGGGAGARGGAGAGAQPARGGRAGQRGARARPRAP